MHLSLILLVLLMLAGCAAGPRKKHLDVKDFDRTYGANTIIDTASGTPVTFEQLMADLKGVRIVYVGEIHTDPVHHQIQLRIINALADQNDDLTVGMEMFDFTYQDVLDRWSAGELDQQLFLEQTQWYANWRFDYNLYKAILDTVKERQLRLVGLNIPFYVPSRIRVGGIDNQQEAVKKLLPGRIDTSDPDHRAYAEEIFNRHRFGGSGNFEYFYQAQCVWDDTMAAATVGNLETGQMVVLAGNGHIIYKFGIPNRAFKRNQAPFRTIYLAPVGTTAEPAYADYIWVTADVEDPS